MGERPRVLLIATGGTIAARPDGAGPGYSPHLAGSELLEQVPGSSAVAAVAVRQFSQKTSFMFTLPEVVQLMHQIRQAASDPDVDAVVIVQGTAAMEEISFLLDLTIATEKPIVMTGAMINSGLLGRDGPRNIYDALRVAVDPRSRGLGVTVCMAGELHAARDVRKLHRTSTTAFGSPQAGPLALVDVDHILYLRPPRKRVHLPVQGVSALVDVIPATLGCDDRLLRAALLSGAQGLVIEGFPGGGGVTAPMMAGVREAIARGIPVVLSSRSPFGRAVAGAGGGAGPSDLHAAGVILSGDLNAAKARILLLCALAGTSNVAEIDRLFRAVAP